MDAVRIAEARPDREVVLLAVGFDATRRFGLAATRSAEGPECIAGAILTGARSPTDRTAYGTHAPRSLPSAPPWSPTEGTCAAFHAAGRTREPR